MKIYVGNDIVDLTNPDISLKHESERFINRVLDKSEIDFLKGSNDPKETLWLLWSGKEAGYKVLKKIYPKISFSHSKFIVTLGESLKDGFLRGSLVYNGNIISLRWTQTKDWVHCVAVLKKEEKYFDVLEYDVKHLDQVSLSTKGFCFKELVSVHSCESVGVRNLAKELLKKNMLEDAKIIRFPLQKKFSPPELYLSEIPLKNWDLSLSHDGKYVSCAVSKAESI